jgi:hypothetical protein
VVKVAAGINDSNMAASIIINPVEILDFITSPLSRRKTAISPMENGKNHPKVPI